MLLNGKKELIQYGTKLLVAVISIVFAAEFEKVMIEIEPNVISEIFETEFGYHFLEVIDTRNYDMTRDLIRDEAYQILYERKFNEELENTLRAIRAEAFVEFKELD